MRLAVLVALVAALGAPGLRSSAWGLEQGGLDPDAANPKQEYQDYIVVVAPSHRPEFIVADESSARRIGSAIIESAIGETEYKKMIAEEWAINTEDSKNFWNVALYHRGCRENRPVVHICFGASAYNVRLNKKDGRVIWIGRGR